ncbi:hypothetical protein [Streptomyces sp. NPDC017991]|uniref:hypothetical protein n=1 Tax=Streptomyces sp. NPDC017991 TaxID=3365026 RepID=UPI00379B2AF6
MASESGETGESDELDGSRGDLAAVTPGEAAAARERAFWESRRRYQELDDDEAGRREKRRLSKESRRMNLEVRMHRYARSHDEGPAPADLRLPPLPPLPPRVDEGEDENERPGR